MGGHLSTESTNQIDHSDTDSEMDEEERELKRLRGNLVYKVTRKSFLIALAKFMLFKIGVYKVHCLENVASQFENS